MAIAGQKMRSTYTPQFDVRKVLDPDLWLTSRYGDGMATVRRHADWFETLIWDNDAPRERRVTSVIQNRSTGAIHSASSEFQTIATKQAKALAGMP